MKVKLAESYGFCFGVKRAIELAEQNPDALTIGPLIHNPKEIDRLKTNFQVTVADSVDEVEQNKRAIIRTHGIEKDEKAKLAQTTNDIIDATCPFVTKPQEIVEEMSREGYQIVIFGDSLHPEVKGVKSYAINDAVVVASLDELKGLKLKNKVAVVSQTTKNVETFKQVAGYIVGECKEVRVFNTICNATFDNQEATRELSRDVDVLLVVGGKNSSNTKQLHAIALEYCPDSHLIEDKNDIDPSWFLNKTLCGITAGASTPSWIINDVIREVERL